MRLYGMMLAMVGVAIGGAIGIGGYTFYYAKGGSYLTNDPRACMNCHIMRDHYYGWLKARHHSVATCNDCHTPDNFFEKYRTKFSNGFWHSVAFTSGRFHEPLRIKPHNQKVVENSCRKCHESIVHTIEMPSRSMKISCTHCHCGVGHP